jgi:hypothetical protein
MDFVALALAVGFFLISWGLTLWCDRALREGGSPR